MRRMNFPRQELLHKNWAHSIPFNLIQPGEGNNSMTVFPTGSEGFVRPPAPARHLSHLVSIEFGAPAYNFSPVIVVVSALVLVYETRPLRENATAPFSTGSCIYSVPVRLNAEHFRQFHLDFL